MRKSAGEFFGVPVIVDDTIPTGTMYCMPRGTIDKRDDESMQEAIDRYVRGNASKCAVITNTGKE